MQFKVNSEIAHMYKFGERLLAERKSRGWDQDQMAAAGGVAKRTYCNYEAGSRDPGAEFLRLLATAGIDVQYILTGAPQAAQEEMDRVRQARDVVMEALVLWSGISSSALAEIHKETIERRLSVPEVFSLLNEALPRAVSYPPPNCQTQTQHAESAIHETQPKAALKAVLADSEGVLLDAYRRCDEDGKRAMEQVAKALAKGR